MKVPQFVILSKQQSVYRGLILSSLKLWGGLDGRHYALIFHNELNFQTPDAKTGLGK